MDPVHKRGRRNLWAKSPLLCRFSYLLSLYQHSLGRETCSVQLLWMQSEAFVGAAASLKVAVNSALYCHTSSVVNYSNPSFKNRFRCGWTRRGNGYAEYSNYSINTSNYSVIYKKALLVLPKHRHVGFVCLFALPCSPKLHHLWSWRNEPLFCLLAEKSPPNRRERKTARVFGRMTGQLGSSGVKTLMSFRADPISDPSRGLSSDALAADSWVVPDCSQTKSSSDTLRWVSGCDSLTVPAAPSGGNNPANQIMFCCLCMCEIISWLIVQRGVGWGENKMCAHIPPNLVPEICKSFCKLLLPHGFPSPPHAVLRFESPLLKESLPDGEY